MLLFTERVPLEGLAVLMDNMMSYLGYAYKSEEELCLEISGHQLGIQNRASSSS